jgi:superfamily I DNA and RNA helicase
MKSPIIGRKINEGAIDTLIDALEALGDEQAVLYVGYPVVATADEAITVPALYVSETFGLIAFDVRPSAGENDISEIRARQDEIGLAVKAKLLQYRDLTEGMDLAFTINVLTYCPSFAPVALWNPEGIVNAQNLRSAMVRAKRFDPKYLKPLNAAIERVANIRPKARRPNAQTPNSRGSILKMIESEIANLDSWQKSAAIEIPEGPQRIRGLAGSGKTIILALKAAYLHGQHPEWKIVVTFHTRSLRQQFRRLVRRFYFEDHRDEPDWDQLLVMHSFGSVSEPGVYSEICRLHGTVPRDFGYARRTYGYGTAFQGICAELLKVVGADPRPIWDAMLIDEAQDLPKEFLRLAFHSTANHRIVWAYDDLQNLSDYQTQSLRETFGVDSEGNQVVTLANRPKQPHQDIILPRCYRNSPWALATAHALGSGIYRQEKLVQHPDDPQLWSDIGYEVREGRLELGKAVVLQRDPTASPEFFRHLLKPEDAIQFFAFSSDEEQLFAVAEMIKDNLVKDELYAHDIVVIFPDAVLAQKRGGIVPADFTRKRNWLSCGGSYYQPRCLPRRWLRGYLGSIPGEGQRGADGLSTGRSILRCRIRADQAPEHTFHFGNSITRLGEGLR